MYRNANWSMRASPMVLVILPALTFPIVALGEPIGSDGAWALRFYVKPFIRWIWLGCLIMAIGGLVAATDRRYRLQARREARMPAGGVARTTP